MQRNKGNGRRSAAHIAPQPNFKEFVWRNRKGLILSESFQNDYQDADPLIGNISRKGNNISHIKAEDVKTRFQDDDLMFITNADGQNKKATQHVFHDRVQDRLAEELKQKIHIAIHTSKSQRDIQEEAGVKSFQDRERGEGDRDSVS
jgi:hypothetical protein